MVLIGVRASQRETLGTWRVSPRPMLQSTCFTWLARTLVEVSSIVGNNKSHSKVHYKRKTLEFFATVPATNNENNNGTSTSTTKQANSQRKMLMQRKRFLAYIRQLMGCTH